MDGETPGAGAIVESGRGATARIPSLRDLATILYRPRETIRRILDSPGGHWASEVVVLASVCSSFVDPDIRRVVDLTLASKLALALLAVLVNAIAWVIVVYLFAWAATSVGRWLEGEGSVRDVRTAVAWGLAPQIWSIVLRIPASMYLMRYIVPPGEKQRVLFDFIREGGCSVTILLMTVQLLLYALIVYVESCCVAEALHFSSWKGLATLAITSAIPIVVGAAAFFATR